MRVSGVIEGFYGPPWSHVDRLTCIDNLASWGMNHYVWAAKQEPRHRDRWQDPFTPAELEQFAELAGRRPAVTVGVALTPGREATSADVVAKLAPSVGRGARALVLCFDDLPTLDSGAKHRQLANDLYARFHDTASVWIVPTHYAGCTGSPYLTELCDGLEPAVEVMWTGDCVVNDSITAAQALRRTEVMRGRRPLLWDNTPVNDAMMSDLLHLGPLTGRDPHLRDCLAGALWNPMQFASASLLQLESCAAWQRGDDPLAAWSAAVDRRGWRRLAQATAADDDPSAPTIDVYDIDLDWWTDMAHCEAPGIDPEVEPWIDAARAGANVVLTAIRLRSLSESEMATLTAVEMVSRWKSYRRRRVLTFGAGPRMRPVITQNDLGEFVLAPGAITVLPSTVDRIVELVLRERSLT